jgi:N-acetylglucosaminyldiphosphoundecaprenol N-acetyl-beta-D-mannosaminyltransferase
MSVQIAVPPHMPGAQTHFARERVDLLGTQVDCVSMSALDLWIETFIASGTPHQIITANLDFITIARRQLDFARVIAEADLVVCDGKPLQWASRIQGPPLPARITGMDLVLHTAKLSSELGYRIFLLGATDGIAERAARKLEELVPGVHIAGWYSPPQGDFDAAEDAHIVRMIRDAGTDALFVALGAPRQDMWISSHLQELQTPLCAGIGGVLNFFAGTTRRAPAFVQRAGMEWAWRLAQEPSRLWRRYLLNDLPLFAELLVKQGMQRLDPAARRGASSQAHASAGALTAQSRSIALSEAPYLGPPVPSRGNLRWNPGQRNRTVRSQPLGQPLPQPVLEPAAAFAVERESIRASGR